MRRATVAGSVADRRPVGLLTERYRPATLSEVVGNGAAVEALRRWAAGWAAGRAPPRYRAALLSGPPGVGKTTVAAALAHDCGWGLVEMNASEARNRDAIDRIAGRASVSNSFSGEETYRSARDGGRTLILLDEADCLSGRAVEERTKSAPVGLRDFLRGRYGTVEALRASWSLASPKTPPAWTSWEEIPQSPGRAGWAQLPNARRDLELWRTPVRARDSSDRGGLAAIAQLVRSTRQPLLLTVNDETPLVRYSPVFRTSVARIEFGPVGEADLRRLLGRILATERRSPEGPVVDAVVARARGDVRAALTDLEAVGPLPDVATQVAALGGRDRATPFADFVREVLEHPRYYRAVEIRERIDAPPDDLLPWIEENLPAAASGPVGRHAAFRALARAEVLLARARRYRQYGLWSYAGEILTGGVGAALDRTATDGALRIQFPAFLAGMGRNRALRSLRRETLTRLGPVLHLSVRKGSETMLPVLFQLFDPGRPGFDGPEAARTRSGLLGAARLEGEQVAYLMGVEPDSERVATELARAEGRPRAPPPPDPEETPLPPRDLVVALPRESPAPPGAIPAAPPVAKPRRQRILGDYDPAAEPGGTP